MLGDLLLPASGFSDIIFYSRDKMEIAKGYIRVVIGKRGPYIEFSSDQIIKENLHIPEDCMWRLKYGYAFYIEYRSNLWSNVKVYFQKKQVTYADYQIGMWYISPYELTSDKYPILIA